MVTSRSVSTQAWSSGLLTGLEQDATHAIIAAAQMRQIPTGNNVITCDQPATNLFLIQTGRVHYYHLTKHGESVLLAWLTPGDVIGLATLLKSPPAYMATAETIADCEVLVWEHSVIRKLAAHHPLLSENGLRIALGYLKHYMERHVGLTTKSAEERLAETVLKLGEKSCEVHANGIEIDATNDQLGALANISPFTTSRVLSNWARAGIVSKGRGRLFLHAPEALMID
jgi:CRP-like cAMP-binding protein